MTMQINNIENNFFTNISISNDAYKLVNAIYNTYNIEDEPYLEIKAKNIINLFPNKSVNESIFCIKKLFLEINEPVLIKNFDFKGKYIYWRALSFCNCHNYIEKESDTLKLDIDEMYIELLKNDKTQKILNI